MLLATTLLTKQEIIRLLKDFNDSPKQQQFFKTEFFVSQGLKLVLKNCPLFYYIPYFLPTQVIKAIVTSTRRANFSFSNRFFLLQQMSVVI